MSFRPAQPETHIDFDLVIPSMVATNHKQVARAIAHELAPLIGIKEQLLAERLAEREKETSSAVGDGVSIAHLHMSGLQNPMNIFIKLKAPIDIGAPDSKGVDIICLLLTPEREGSAYLRTLARLSRLLRNAQICSRLRSASNEKMVRAVFEQSSFQRAA